MGKNQKASYFEYFLVSFTVTYSSVQYPFTFKFIHSYFQYSSQVSLRIFPGVSGSFLVPCNDPLFYPSSTSQFLHNILIDSLQDHLQRSKFLKLGQVLLKSYTVTSQFLDMCLSQLICSIYPICPQFLSSFSQL